MGEASFVTYRFESAEHPGTAFQVESMRLVEALNEPYRLELEITHDDPEADLGAMVARDCTLEIVRGSRTRRVCGIVRHFEDGEQNEQRSPRVVVVPALWALGLRRNTRIFQEKTAPEIIEAVLAEGLGPYGRQLQLELRGSYARREYCVQYQETDLDFVHRLMEEEGIGYTFDHEGPTEVLILRDSNDAYSELPAGAAVPYEPHDFAITEHEPINLFHRRRTTTTTSVVVRDWDWTKGTMPVSSEARGQDPLGRDRESYEHGEGRSLAIWDYDQGLRAYREHDGAQQARVRREAHARDAILCEGIGRVTGLAPGAIFELGGHPDVGLDGRYLVLRVEHVSLPLREALPGAGGGDEYHNRFECIPLETPYRPTRRTPKPVIPGIQTAVVTGPSGEEIHTDEHGRIKVQFHWDREGRRDEHSSCWIRVQQPWAGPGFGFWYLPRIGMEVVVHFVDGDPDRPLVTGCVYNGSNLLPYPLPDEKTKSTIKSNSTPGGGGFNEFRFEDKAGSEEIYTHAQKDYNEVVENDHNTLVHHDQTNTVDNDQTQTIHANQIETVHGNQTMTVDGNRTVVVDGNFDETVDGTETRHVAGDVSERFDSNETRSIGANVTERIGGNETRTIGANQTETIRGNATLNITGSSAHQIGGALSQTVDGGISVDTPASYSITAVGGLNVTAAAGIKLDAPGGITLAAPGGVTMVDSFWEWIGNSKASKGSFSRSYTHIKDDFVGTAFEVTILKGELSVFDANQTICEVKTDGLAILSPITNLRVGAVVVESGPQVS